MKHYQEDEAIKAVARMFSSQGVGEHWSFDQIVKMAAPYVGLMGDEDTFWDAYVAVNMWWHDLGDVYKRRGVPDDWLVEDALTWAFKDADSPDGKVWRMTQEG